MTEPCNIENMTTFVEALESGDYPQGTGELRYTSIITGGDYFCCLGVACDISQVGTWHRDRFGSWGYYTTGFTPEEVLLPRAVADWLGIDTLDPEIDKYNERTATALNDIERATFPEIARAFRETYLED